LLPNVVGCEVEGVGGDLFDDEHCLCCPCRVGVGGDLCDCFVSGFGSGGHCSQPRLFARQLDGEWFASTACFISRSSYSLTMWMQGSDPSSNSVSSKIVVGSASCISQTGGPHHPCLYPCCSHSSKFISFWSLVVFGGCLRMLVVQIV